MPDLDDFKQNPEAALWEAIDDTRAVMLSAEGGDRHMQPMAPQVAADEKTVYFYTDKTSNLAQNVSAAAKPGMMCVANDDEGVHACLTGTLSISHDQNKIDEYWSPMVAAWFENGKDDPNLTMLAFKPNDAAIWASTDSTLAFGWQIAKANVTGDKPDVGFHTVINIAGGAA